MPWQVPSRHAVLPVSPEQSCAVCGSEDWAWLYLLLTAPEWVQQLGWFANWFVVMCSPCHGSWEAGDRVRLEAAWAAKDGDGEPDPESYISVVKAMQSEQPLPRSEVTSS